MIRLLGELRTILSLPYYRRLAVGIGAVYLVLFLVALQDISLGGRGFQLVTLVWILGRTDTALLAAAR